MDNKNVGIDIGGTKMQMLAIFNGQYFERTVPTGITAKKEYIKAEIFKFINSLPFEVESSGIAMPGLEDDNCWCIRCGEFRWSDCRIFRMANIM